MEIGQMLVAVLFFALGTLYIVRPDIGFRIRTYIARKLFDMKVEPGRRTYIAYRIIGAAFILIAIAMLLR